MAQKVTSTDIKLALKEFHNGKPSYFITECKTCSTYFPDPQGLLKFDGLAITKSYTKPNIIGYEIKVSRNDFLQDNKWHLYLQYCNEFYFVVPKGLVKKEELPDHVGLIYFNPDTKALRTIKKALYRQIEEPVGVYKYIIFSRLEEDLKRIKQEAMEDAINTAMTLLLVLPMEVLMDHYWKKTYAKKIPEFTELVLQYYERWQNGELDMDEMKKDLWEYGGVRLEEREAE